MRTIALAPPRIFRIEPLHMDVGTPQQPLPGAPRETRRHFIAPILVVLIACTALPALRAHAEKRRAESLDAMLQVMRDAIHQHHVARGVYPPTLATLVETRYLRAIPKDPVLDRNDAWSLTLVTVEGVTGIRDVHSGAESRDSTGRPWASR